MIPLFGTDEWSEEKIDNAVAFELGISQSLPSLSEELPVEYADGGSPSGASDQAKAVESLSASIRAAEILFASGNVDRGIEVLSPIAYTEFSEFLYPADAIQALLTPYSFYNIQQRAHHYLESHVYLINQENTEILFPDLQHVASAVAAYKDVGAINWFIEFLSKILLSKTRYNNFLHTDQGRILAMLTHNSVVGIEFEIIQSPPASGRQYFDFDLLQLQKILRIFNHLEGDYQKKIDRVRNDRWHWQNVRLRGSVIDWSLLALWVGIMKRYGTKWPSDSDYEASAFIRDLAKAFLDRDATSSDPSH